MRGTWWHAWNPRVLLNLVANAPQETARRGAAPERRRRPGLNTPWLDANQAIPGIIRSGFIMAYQFRGKHRGALSDREKIGIRARRNERSFRVPGSVSSLLVVIRTRSRELLSPRQLKAFAGDSPIPRSDLKSYELSYLPIFVYL